jgi:hypothetical protein
MGTLTPAFPLCYCFHSAGVGIGVGIGHPDAGVYCALALLCAGITVRWHYCALALGTSGLPRRRRFHFAGVRKTLAWTGRWRWKGSQNGSPDAVVSVALASESMVYLDASVLVVPA